MKKALLIGAVVSSMALSSVSFAAVDYENATAWTKDTDFAYNIETGVLTLVGDKTNANATTDTTIVVVNGENPADITKDNIMYIDQAASAATYGNMGLLLPEPIAEGAKATVLFNDGTAAIYTATFDLAEAQDDTQYIKFVYGDVNNGEYVEGAETMDSVDASDALALLKASVGGEKAKGGIASIGDVLTTDAGTKFVFGDVNNGAYVAGTETMDSVDASDALALLKASVGGEKAKGGIANIGDIVSVVVE